MCYMYLDYRYIGGSIGGTLWYLFSPVLSPQRSGDCVTLLQPHPQHL